MIKFSSKYKTDWLDLFWVSSEAMTVRLHDWEMVKYITDNGKYIWERMSGIERLSGIEGMSGIDSWRKNIFQNFVDMKGMLQNFKMF